MYLKQEGQFTKLSQKAKWEYYSGRMLSKLKKTLKEMSNVQY